MNNNFDYEKKSVKQKNMLLIFLSIILIVTGYVLSITGIFDKVKSIDTNIEKKVVYVGDKEKLTVKVGTNKEFNPKVKFKSQRGKVKFSEEVQYGEEVETSIIGEDTGEETVIIEVGTEKGRKIKKEKVQILVCNVPEIINTSDNIINLVGTEEIELKFNISDECLEGYKIYIENNKIAEIDENYVLKGKKVGKTYLILQRGTAKIKYIINVVAAKTTVKDVVVATKSISVKVGKQAKIIASVTPSNAYNRKLIYESNDESIATVTKEGKVLGLKAGTTIINVISDEDSSKSKTIKVKVYKSSEQPSKPIKPVEPIAVIGIRFDNANYSIMVNESKTLTPTITPENADNKKISCTSSNTNVLAISTSGKDCVIKGKKEGSATVTAKTKDGNKVATTKVTVNKLDTTIKVTNIKFGDNNYTIALDKIKKLTVLITPINATNKNITCRSKNNSIVEASASGNVCTIKGKKIGTTVIEAYSEDGNKKATTTIKVVPIKVTGISFTSANYTVNINETKELKVNIIPLNANNKKIKCTSSNTSIATVSAKNKDCVVKGIKEGTVTITATTQDGSNKSATTKVTVNKKDTPIKVTGIAFEKETYSMYVGDSKTLTPTITPKNATNKKIKCESNDKKIATVIPKGSSCVVKGIKEGTVTITATTQDGSKVTKTKININKKPIPVTGIKFDSTSYTISLNATKAITLGITPTNATNKTITCKSQNTKIVTVTSSGNTCTIKGIKVGTTRIEAYSVDGNKKAVASITISPIKVTSLKFGSSSYTIKANGTKNLPVTVLPTNASNKTISCTSSNTSVATASAKGSNCFVKGLKAGNVTITATAQDGSGKTATTTLKVETAQTTTEYTIKYYCDFQNSSTKAFATQKVKAGEKVKIVANTCSNNTGKYANRSKWRDPAGGVWDEGKEYTWTYKKGEWGINESNVLILTSVPNSRVYASYNSGTLKYYIEKYGSPEGRTRNSNYIVTHIWMKDPYNQFRMAITKKKSADQTEEYPRELKNPRALMEAEVTNKNLTNKGLIAINASPMINGYWGKSCPDEWIGTSILPFKMHNGKIIRDSSTDPKVGCSTGNKVYMLGKDGYLTYYTFHSASSKYFSNNEKTRNTIVNKVQPKYTFGFKPVLVWDGKNKANECTNKELCVGANLRQSICQIDKNDFILITTMSDDVNKRSGGLEVQYLADLMIKYNCKTGFNLDGGGSTSYFYKKNTKCGNQYALCGITGTYYGRSNVEMLYFAEK